MKNSSQLQKCMVIKSSPYKGWHRPTPCPALTLPPPDISPLRLRELPGSRTLRPVCCGRLDGAATDLAACLLPFPAASLWSWGEQMSFSSFGKMSFGGMDERVSRYPFRDGPDVRVTQRHL